MAEHEEYILPFPQKGHGAFHGLHADEQQAEAQHSATHMGQTAFLLEKAEQRTDNDKKVGEILDFDGQKLACHRSADVGSHNDADGLLQGHESGIHKAHSHHRGGAAALDEHGHARAHYDAQQRRPGEHADDLPHFVARKHLEGFADEPYRKEKESYSSQKLNKIG